MKFSAKRRFGDIGENLACQFLMKRGVRILKRNYLKPWGEIDIVGLKHGIYHFVEVKSVSGQIKPLGSPDDVIHETSGNYFRPEENVHPKKLERMHKTIGSYLMENNVENDWQIDIITIKMDESTRRARIEIIENIVG